MGVKSVMAFSSLAVIALLCQVTGLLLPMSKVMFMTTIFKLFTLNVNVLSYEIPTGSDVCTVATIIGQRPKLASTLAFDICDAAIQGNLQDVAQRMCTPLLVTFWGQTLCESVSHAYYFGFMLVGVVALNCLLVLVACFILWAYASSSAPRQSSRFNALFVHGAGTLVLIGGILAYFFMVIFNVNINHSNGFTGLWLSANGEGGTSIGFFLVCTGAGIQIIMLALGYSIRTSRELTKEEVLDIKSQAKLDALEAHSYGAAFQAPPVMMPQPLPLPYGQYQQPQYAGYAPPQAVW